MLLAGELPDGTTSYVNTPVTGIVVGRNVKFGGANFDIAADGSVVGAQP